MEDGIQRDGAAKLAARRIERVQIRRGVAGWHLVPADPAHHPLLARLFGPDAHGNPPGPVVRDEDRKPLQWDSLADGLVEVRAAAKDCGVAVRVCGDMHRHPTLLLSERPADPKAAEPMARPFGGLGGGYAGQWGRSATSTNVTRRP